VKWADIHSELTEQTAPTAVLMTTALAKDFLRSGESTEGTVIDNLVDTARLQIEQDTGRAMVNTVYDLWVDSFPSERAIVLPRWPLVTVASIKSYDKDDVETTMASGDYLVDTGQGRLALNSDASWPSDLRVFSGGVIRFTAGYGATAATVPRGLMHAAELLLTHWFDQGRDPVVVGTSVQETVFGYGRSIFPYRREFLG